MSVRSQRSRAEGSLNADREVTGAASLRSKGETLPVTGQAANHVPRAKVWDKIDVIVDSESNWSLNWFSGLIRDQSTGIPVMPIGTARPLAGTE